MEKAIAFEFERQMDILEEGGKVVQETRLFDVDEGETRSMRSKEEANDYRYFPDPDLLPVVLDDAYIEAVRKELPELPNEKKHRFITHLGLSGYDASALTSSRELAAYFEAVAEVAGDNKQAANWVMGELSAALNKEGTALADSPVTAAMLGGMIQRITDNTISGKIAKQVFEAMWNGEGDADTVIDKRGLKQITDTGAIEAMIDEVIAANPAQAEQFRAGKEQLLGFFVGQVMKVSKGQANPGQVNQILRDKLK
jgi:aspartyl-tRNA(Asn)/glutamyl-tRNA(Gln) amidotransferase subunit B